MDYRCVAEFDLLKHVGEFRLIILLIWIWEHSLQGHSCDVCGIHVHHKCQRQADVSNPCVKCVKPGDESGKAGGSKAVDPKGAPLDSHFVMPESVKALLPDDNKTIDGALTVGKSWAMETAKVNTFEFQI